MGTRQGRQYSKNATDSEWLEELARERGWSPDDSGASLIAIAVAPMSKSSDYDTTQTARTISSIESMRTDGRRFYE